jgi:small conductance mechanosensitive channel
MTLRATYLRDNLGKLHTVPNGDIRVIGNATREWSRAVVDLTLPAGADVGRANQALQAGLARLASDPAVRDLLVGEPELVSWNNLIDWAVQVRLAARTLPGQQAAVAQALRRVAVEALRGAGILAGPAAPVSAEGA